METMQEVTKFNVYALSRHIYGRSKLHHIFDFSHTYVSGQLCNFIVKN